MKLAKSHSSHILLHSKEKRPFFLLAKGNAPSCLEPKRAACEAEKGTQPVIQRIACHDYPEGFENNENQINQMPVQLKQLFGGRDSIGGLSVSRVINWNQLQKQTSSRARCHSYEEFLRLILEIEESIYAEILSCGCPCLG